MITESLFNRVYEIVRLIPVGKVATYGQIASLTGEQRITPRVVGFALHANRSSSVPCHRVVNQAGRLAPGFAFDGPVEQRRRLEREGVPFNAQGLVDLKRCLWQTDDLNQPAVQC